jgi:hypothetical protein
MNACSTFIRPGTISQRVRDIQANWNPIKRRQRACQGRRRLERLGRLVVAPCKTAEVWAVGALDTADLHRLAAEQ